MSRRDFMRHGVAKLAQKFQLKQPSVFLSYAWGSEGPKRVVLQQWLKDLRDDLLAGGFVCKLDICDMQENVVTYMQGEILNADVVCVICTPELKARAAEGEAGKLSIQQLAALADDDLDEFKFNNLQKELWYVSQLDAAKKLRAFLFIREGSFGSSVPTNFFPGTKYFVRDMVDVNQLDHQLLNLNEPVGLVPSLLSLPNKQLEPVYTQYASMLSSYLSPDSSPITHLLLQLCHQAHQYEQEMELEQLSNFYVPLNCQIGKTSNAHREELQQTITEFLSLSNTKHPVCLLLGDAGTGKTTFGAMLQRQLWSEFLPFSLDPLIPVRIELKRYNRNTARHCVIDTLSVDNVRLLQTAGIRVLFLFDGYDELAGGGLLNLWEANELSKFAPGTKAIITCRPEYLANENYRPMFAPARHDGLFERHLSTMTLQQTTAYLRTSPDVNKDVGVDAYESFLISTPGLVDLISSPFLIKIYVSAFHGLRTALKPGINITSDHLYSAFMAEWFAKEDKNIADITGRALPDAQKTFSDFSRSLAFAMFQRELNEVEYKEVEEQNDINPFEADFLSEEELNARKLKTSSYNQWQKWFSQKDPKATLARRGCPLRSLGGTKFSFVHQSFLEYFIADQLWQMLLTEKPHKKISEVWGTRCLSKAPKMPVVVGFLVDRLRTYGAESDKARVNLWWLLAQSKTDKTSQLDEKGLTMARYAGSNAITVLNTAGTPMSVKERDNPGFFRGIQVPHADLTMAQFYHVDLTDADLSNCLLVGVKMRGAILDGCNMAGVDFLQWPMLLFEDRVWCVSLYRETASLDCTRMAVAVGSEVHIMLKSAESQWEWQPNLVLKGHADIVWNVAWSQDGTQVVSSGKDKTVRIWNAVSGLPGPVLQGHTDTVRSAAWSPDGNRLASGSDDNTVRLWNCIDGLSGPILRGHVSEITSVGWSPGGHRLVSGSWDKTVRLWNAMSGRPGLVLQGHTEAVRGVAWSPDGSQLASCSHDMTVRLWNADSGQPGPVMQGHAWHVTCVGWSPDSTQVVSGSDDRTVRLWNAVSGQPGPDIQGHASYVTSVVWAPDGSQVVSGSWDGTVRLWNTANGPPGTSHVQFMSAAWSPDSCQVASGSWNGTVQLWNAENGGPGHALQGHTETVVSLMWSPDGTQLASGCWDGTVRLWNSANGHPGPVLQVRIESEASGSVSPGSYYKLVQMWNIARGQTDTVMQGHPESVWRWIWTPDGSLLVSANDETARILNATRWQSGPALHDTTNTVTSVAWSPDGCQLASGGWDTKVRVWNVGNGQLNLVLQRHTGWVMCVAWSPNGNQLVSGGSDNTLQIWNAISWQPSLTLCGHSHWIMSVGWSPDSSQLVSGSGDNTVRIWNAQSGQPRLIMRGHTGEILSVAWSPDGTKIVSGGRDSTVRLWSAVNGEPGPVLQGHTSAVNRVVWSPDSTQLFSGCWDETVRLWNTVIDPNLPDFSAAVWQTRWSMPYSSRLELAAARFQAAANLPPAARELFLQA